MLAEITSLNDAFAHPTNVLTVGPLAIAFLVVAGLILRVVARRLAKR